MCLIASISIGRARLVRILQQEKSIELSVYCCKISVIEFRCAQQSLIKFLIQHSGFALKFVWNQTNLQIYGPTRTLQQIINQIPIELLVARGTTRKAKQNITVIPRQIQSQSLSVSRWQSRSLEVLLVQLSYSYNTGCFLTEVEEQYRALFYKTQGYQSQYQQQGSQYLSQFQPQSSQITTQRYLKIHMPRVKKTQQSLKVMGIKASFYYVYTYVIIEFDYFCSSISAYKHVLLCAQCQSGLRTVCMVFVSYLQSVLYCI
eukprot:TRINITY_DN600_c0_g1_i5.p3 TRINITY_DN600_c0_g1~~TRINITY_DN600_c0_g1_i5.p3  ORF type:complete len:260 (-),score=-29.14 TRINITY_DN600_c0_g1_i5:14-793(-)